MSDFLRTEEYRHNTRLSTCVSTCDTLGIYITISTELSTFSFVLPVEMAREFARNIHHKAAEFMAGQEKEVA